MTAPPDSAPVFKPSSTAGRASVYDGVLRALSRCPRHTSREGTSRSSARVGDGRRAVAARDIGRRTDEGDQGRSLDQHTETTVPDDTDGKWLSVCEVEESQAKIEARHSSRVKAGDPWCLSQNSK
jgi:hypothetical protein